MENTTTKIRLPTNMEKYISILCTAILYRLTLQTVTLLNQNKRIYSQMYHRHKSAM